MGGEDAYDLITRCVKAYRGEHHHAPARLVILKVARFQAGVPQNDLVWVSEGGHQTMVREGDYPPLRESAVELGPDLLLFTRGSVPYYRTYPGMRIPRPLLLPPHDCDTSIGETSGEIMAVTKMNWNTTQFDQALPIPINAARKVGKVLKHLCICEMERSDHH